MMFRYSQFDPLYRSTFLALRIPAIFRTFSWHNEISWESIANPFG
jgi:hypothetical protein